MSDDLLRDLIEGEREALVPGKGARETTWAAVTRSVGEGAAPIVDPADVVGPASGASWLKIVVALVLGGGVVIGVASSIGSEPSTRAHAVAVEPAPPRARPVVEAAPIATAPVIAADLEPAVVPAIVPPVEPLAETTASEPVGANKREARPRARAAPIAQAEDPPPTADASALAEEARLLAAARSALRRGAHEDALARLAEHARRFPSGQLSEDRLALTARAHCSRGELEQGRRAAAELRRAFPRSSQLHRIDRDCD
jgi:hypothetical protein